MEKYLEYFDNLTLVALFIVLMFFLSGINKIFTFESTVSSLEKKLGWNLCRNFYSFAIIAVILIEIVAPIVILYYTNTKKIDKKYAYWSVLSLIGFTVLATVLYHPPVLDNYMKSIPFLSNITTIGGLLLLARTIKNN